MDYFLVCLVVADILNQELVTLLRLTIAILLQKTIVTLLHKTLVETVVTNSQHLLLVLLSQITAIQDLAGISVLALDVDNCTFSTNK